MRITHITLLLAAFVFFLPANAGKVFKIVDKETGRITFTDKPPTTEQGTLTSHTLPAINTQPAVKIPKLKPQSQQDSTTANYTSLEVVQPKDQTTIPPGQLNLVIQLQAKPQLQKGHRVQLYYDHRKYGKPASATSFKINGLQRGAHNVSASIVDTAGHTIISSQTITVYVHRASVHN